MATAATPQFMGPSRQMCSQTLGSMQNQDKKNNTPKKQERMTHTVRDAVKEIKSRGEGKAAGLATVRS